MKLSQKPVKLTATTMIETIMKRTLDEIFINKFGGKAEAEMLKLYFNPASGNQFGSLTLKAQVERAIHIEQPGERSEVSDDSPLGPLLAKLKGHIDTLESYIGPNAMQKVQLKSSLSAGLKLIENHFEYHMEELKNTLRDMGIDPETVNLEFDRAKQSIFDSQPFPGSTILAQYLEHEVKQNLGLEDGKDSSIRVN